MNLLEAGGDITEVSQALLIAGGLVALLGIVIITLELFCVMVSHAAGTVVRLLHSPAQHIGGIHIPEHWWAVVELHGSPLPVKISQHVYHALDVGHTLHLKVTKNRVLALLGYHRRRVEGMLPTSDTPVVTPATTLPATQGVGTSGGNPSAPSQARATRVIDAQTGRVMFELNS